jgi:hypothetical protein
VQQVLGDLLHPGQSDAGALFDGERVAGGLEFDDGR